MALSHLSGYLNNSEKTVIDTMLSNLVSAITYQFGLFPKQTNNKVNILHERALTFVLKICKGNLSIQLHQRIEIYNQ